MASPKTPKVERVAFVGGNIPGGLRDRLKAVADANDRSIAKELRRAVQAHVEAHEQDASEANGGVA